MPRAMEELAVEPCSVDGCHRTAQRGRKGLCQRHFFAERAERRRQATARPADDTPPVDEVTPVAEAVELCEELGVPFIWIADGAVLVGFPPNGLRYHVTNELGWVRVGESEIE